MGFIGYIAIGLAAGIFSGIFGIGGGSLMIPGLVLFYGMSQHMAQGTTLAVLCLPVLLLAAVRYYYDGNVNFPAALWMGSGLIVGALLGAHLVHYIPGPQLKKMFGVFLIIVGIKMIF